MSATGGWLTKLVMTRVNTENNCFIGIDGPTGIGKSATALALAQKWDRFFNINRVCFTALEFLEQLNIVPKKGWIVWDEAGVGLSHRRWQSEENISIMDILQSGRYRFVNIIFCVPSVKWIDKIGRNLLHFRIYKESRKLGTVYVNSTNRFTGEEFWDAIGSVFLELPTPHLLKAFQEKHKKRHDEYYEQIKQQLELKEKKAVEKLEKELRPTASSDEVLEKAKYLLYKRGMIDMTKENDQGLINMGTLKEELNLPHSQAYELRKKLLVELHKDDDKLLREIKGES
jgi:hypothetical protein